MNWTLSERKRCRGPGPAHGRLPGTEPGRGAGEARSRGGVCPAAGRWRPGPVCPDGRVPHRRTQGSPWLPHTPCPSRSPRSSCHAPLSLTAGTSTRHGPGRVAPGVAPRGSLGVRLRPTVSHALRVGPRPTPREHDLPRAQREHPEPPALTPWAALSQSPETSAGPRRVLSRAAVTAG